MAGIKASVMAEPQLARWSLQTVPGQAGNALAHAQGARPDMAMTRRDCGYSARRSPSELSLPLSYRVACFRERRHPGGNVIPLT